MGPRGVGTGPSPTRHTGPLTFRRRLRKPQRSSRGVFRRPLYRRPHRLDSTGLTPLISLVRDCRLGVCRVGVDPSSNQPRHDVAHSLDVPQRPVPDRPLFQGPRLYGPPSGVQRNTYNRPLPEGSPFVSVGGLPSLHPYPEESGVPGPIGTSRSPVVRPTGSGGRAFGAPTTSGRPRPERVPAPVETSQTLLRSVPFPSGVRSPLQAELDLGYSGVKEGTFDSRSQEEWGPQTRGPRYKSRGSVRLKVSTFLTETGRRMEGRYWPWGLQGGSLNLHVPVHVGPGVETGRGSRVTPPTVGSLPSPDGSSVSSSSLLTGTGSSL